MKTKIDANKKKVDDQGAEASDDRDVSSHQDKLHIDDLHSTTKPINAINEARPIDEESISNTSLRLTDAGEEEEDKDQKPAIPPPSPKFGEQGGEKSSLI
jgi:hypothetical protein